MHQAEFERVGGNQSPCSTTGSRPATHEYIDHPPPLLSERAFRAALGGMSERKFQELRVTGVVDPPLMLGPRVSRWTPQDVAATVARLPRREKAPEPETLAQGRRARIERTRGAA